MKPILFKTEMVRAILDDRKTVTRRAVKPQPEITPIPTFGGDYRISMKRNVFVKPPYRPGDILYVRETWCKTDCFGLQDGYVYKANDNSILEHTGFTPKWHPSIHMPREAARIFLRVTDVRVEKLRPISDTDCMAEGITCAWNVDLPDAFAEVWDSTIKPKDRAIYGWEANPWVWVIEFERCEKPKDAE